MESKTDEKSNLPTPGNRGNTSLHSIAQRWLVMLSGKGSDPYKKIGPWMQYLIMQMSTVLKIKTFGIIFLDSIRW